MKKILGNIFLLFFSLTTSAQQQTSYTQYTLNRFALNPAIAGIKPCAETTFGSRKQWVGFENAPSHYFLSAHTRLNRDDKYPKNFHGIGAFIADDRLGFDHTFYIKLAYAYHIKPWTNYHLSFGIYGGIQRHGFSYNSIRLNNKALDPAINQEKTSTFVYPEISPGIFLYNRTFYAGLSMFQVYPTEKKDLGTKQNKLAGHYFLMAGYRFRGESIDFTPSFLFNFTPFISPTMDITLTLDFKEVISLALGSKYLNSAYTSFSVNVLKTVKLGYSFEYALSTLSNAAPVTHEIILSISSCTTEKTSNTFFCPAYQ